MAPAPAAASEADRDAKIEQLLLAGLDHYFAAQYDCAISVWTRVLFLDRSHARARAYIDRRAARLRSDSGIRGIAQSCAARFSAAMAVKRVARAGCH
jgi:hypothetical protein